MAIDGNTAVVALAALAGGAAALPWVWRRMQAPALRWDPGRADRSRLDRLALGVPGVARAPRLLRPRSSWPEGDEGQTALAVANMREIDHGFTARDFLGEGRPVFAQILEGCLAGRVDPLRDLVSPDVFEAFAQVARLKHEAGLKVQAEISGVVDAGVREARFDPVTGEGQITVSFLAEGRFEVRRRDRRLMSSGSEPVRRRETWTFVRAFHAGPGSPWILAATDPDGRRESKVSYDRAPGAIDHRAAA